MSKLNDPELLHVFAFTDERREERTLFIVTEKHAWLGAGGFELYASSDNDAEQDILSARRIATGPSFRDGLFGTSIFGGDRATVFLPDPFPHSETERLNPELYWFWPSGMVNYLLRPVPSKDYEFLARCYGTFDEDAFARGMYAPIFRRKMLVR